MTAWSKPLKRREKRFKASGERKNSLNAGKGTVDDLHYPFSLKYLCDMTRSYFRILSKVTKRSPEQNLTIDQLAKWCTAEKGTLGNDPIERLTIWLTVWWNIGFATIVCLMVASKKNIPTQWLLRLELWSSDMWVDELVNRHNVIPEKVEFFMYREDVLNIPIVVSKCKDVFYIEDGNHRHKARQKRGFKKIRAIQI